MRIGLTGGIASGKSTAARWFTSQGIQVVDTDALAHSLTGPHGAALPALLSTFGAELVQPDRGLLRPQMRAHILAHPPAKQELEALLHPLINTAAEAAVTSDWVVFDVPLLVESPRWRPKVDRVLVVDCDESMQIARGASRPGWSEAQVQQVMALQASRTQRRAAGDACIDNSTPDLANFHRNLGAVIRNWGWDVKESPA